MGVDVGGTFTDIVVYDREKAEIISAKVPTTPENQAIAVMQSLEVTDVPASNVAFMAHGTTTGTNALIERKGAHTALLSTNGFRDVLEIMRTDRETGYDLSWEKPRPLVRRRFRREVMERVDKDGGIELSLDEEHARTVIQELLGFGVESIAVSLLHSYANAQHEQRLREIVLEEKPDGYVSLSSEINAEYREFERTSTTVIDAYIKPIMARYIRRLVSELDRAGLDRSLFLMQGSGGMITADRAIDKPIRTLSSGPAAGAIAAAKICSQAGLGDVVTFDVGGTSTDVSLIHGGEPFVTHAKQVEWGLHARVPMIDVESVGAGGGSIAWIDEGGGLKVGPQSAGANPGPICYDRGGTEPAVSDALLVAGVLGQEIANGRVQLDSDRAKVGLQTLADELGLSLDRLVAGVIEIAEANMANAVRSVSIWKGLDPRDLTLVAFGGAGGMVAGHVARTLDIPRVLVPMFPGNTCAMGLLMTDMQEDATVSYLARAPEIDPQTLNGRLNDLRMRVETTLANQGVSTADMAFRYFADIRYHGQIHELSVPLESIPVTQSMLTKAFAAFEQMYEEIYTIRLEEGTPEMTSVRVTGVGHIPQYELGDFQADSTAKSKSVRNVLEHDRWVRSDVLWRYSLPVGTTVEGPAIIEEPGSTIWVASGMSAQIDPHGNVVITTDSKAGTG